MAWHLPAISMEVDPWARAAQLPEAERQEGEAPDVELEGSVLGESRHSAVSESNREEWEQWYRSDWQRWSWPESWNKPRTSNSWDACGDEDRDRERGGGADKIVVPEFSAEEDRDGLKARGYLRKVAAWRRVTKIKPHKQALMLCNHLTGRAWRDAEELDLASTA